VWPTSLKGWWERGMIIEEDGDQKMFADGWWEMRKTFAEQGVTLFYPYGAPAGSDQSFRFPPDGRMGRLSKYVYGIIENKTTKVQQLVRSFEPLQFTFFFSYNNSHPMYIPLV
jgi:hypothetical protein